MYSKSGTTIGLYLYFQFKKDRKYALKYFQFEKKKVFLRCFCLFRDRAPLREFLVS